MGVLFVQISSFWIRHRFAVRHQFVSLLQRSVSLSTLGLPIAVRHPTRKGSGFDWGMHNGSQSVAVLLVSRDSSHTVTCPTEPVELNAGSQTCRERHIKCKYNCRLKIRRSSTALGDSGSIPCYNCTKSNKECKATSWWLFRPSSNSQSPQHCRPQTRRVGISSMLSGQDGSGQPENREKCAPGPRISSWTQGSRNAMSLELCPALAHREISDIRESNSRRSFRPTRIVSAAECQ